MNRACRAHSHSVCAGVQENVVTEREVGNARGHERCSHPQGMAITTSIGRPPTHPRLIPADRVRREPPSGWTESDTLFVLLLFAAVAICALVPLALL